MHCRCGTVGLRDFCHILTLLLPGASLFHKHMSSFGNVYLLKNRRHGILYVHMSVWLRTDCAYFFLLCNMLLGACSKASGTRSFHHILTLWIWNWLNHCVHLHRTLQTYSPWREDDAYWFYRSEDKVTINKYRNIVLNMIKPRWGFDQTRHTLLMMRGWNLYFQGQKSVVKVTKDTKPSEHDGDHTIQAYHDQIWHTYCWKCDLSIFKVKGQGYNGLSYVVTLHYQVPLFCCHTSQSKLNMRPLNTLVSIFVLLRKCASRFEK